jgi:hypothetical protein
MTAPEFGSYVVRRFCESYKASSPVTLTLLNLAHAPRLFELAEALAVELAIAIGNPQARDRIIDLFFESQTEDGKPFVDVADLCLSLSSAGGHASLVQKALDLGNFLASPQGKVVGLSDTGGRTAIGCRARSQRRPVGEAQWPQPLRSARCAPRRPQCGEEPLPQLRVCPKDALERPGAQPRESELAGRKRRDHG